MSSITGTSWIEISQLRERLDRRARSVLATLGALSLVTATVVVGSGAEPAEAGWSSVDRLWESESCGVTESLVIPPGVTEVLVTANGGGGGAGGGQGGGPGGPGGVGGRVQDEYAVTAGTVVSVVAGCLGADGSAVVNSTPTPGWTAGGGAGRGSTTAFEGGASGGAGGGATGVCIGSATCAPGSPNLRLVAGGGGGGGVANCAGMSAADSKGGEGGVEASTGANGGVGESGGSGSPNPGNGGVGGVNSSGGSGTGATSADGSGGLGVNVVGGGGGGGYVGGGAGQGSAGPCVRGGGGGGGSDWFHGTLGYTGGHCPACEPVIGSVSVRMRYPATVTLTSPGNPAAPGAFIWFQVAVTDHLGPVTYSDVEFFLDGVSFGTVNTGASGFASASRTFTTAGSYLIEARLVSTVDAGEASDSLVQVIEEPVDTTTSTEPVDTTTSTEPVDSTTSTEPDETTTTSTEPVDSTTSTEPDETTTTSEIEAATSTSLPGPSTTEGPGGPSTSDSPLVGSGGITRSDRGGGSSYRTGRSSLPETGSDLAPITVAAVVALCTGAAVLALRRRVQTRG